MELLVRRETSQAMNPRPSLPLNQSAYKVVVSAAVFMALATVAVTLRFYARHLKQVSYGLEDWSLLASTIIFYAYASMNILVVCVGGIGYHVNDLGMAQLQRGLKILVALQIVYAIGLWLIKCSICLMLIRIFFVRRFRLAAYSVIAFCTAWALMTILVAFLICRPLDYNWNLLPTVGHCGNRLASDAAVGIIGIFSDVAVLVLPLSMIWNLQVPNATRVALTSILCLGVFTIAMSIARVVSIFGTDFEDFTFDSYNFCWPVLEYGVAIIVCCCPLLRPVFEKHAIFPLRNHSNKTENSTGSATLHKPRRLDYGQLSEGEIPLQSMAAPISLTSITGIGSQHKHHTMINHGVSKGKDLNLGSRGANLQGPSIIVERGWDVDGGIG